MDYVGRAALVDVRREPVHHLGRVAEWQALDAIRFTA
jgi:hypothetical protein